MAFHEWSLKKHIFFSFVAILLVIFLFESMLRVVYFNLKFDEPLAIMTTVEYARRWIEKKKIMKAVSHAKQFSNDFGAIGDALYEREGEAILEELTNTYEEHFSQLVKEVELVNSKFIVLYVPYGEKWNDRKGVYCRKFFGRLAEKYNIDFVDVTGILTKEQWELVTLLPENGHFSRFGNQLIAMELSKYLKKYEGYKSSERYSAVPQILGDLKTDSEEIWKMDTRMPYLVVTNKHGLRMTRPLIVPKSKQRVLVLGDSVTFGPYLPNHATYPALLEKLNPQMEVLNAGIMSYTIDDEKSLFIERAKFSAPDITILQVLNNDIFDLLSFPRNWTARKNRGSYKPSEKEKNFIKYLEYARKVK